MTDRKSKLIRHIEGGSARALLVYPEFPKTFWSFKYALTFISKKSGMTPPGTFNGGRHAPQRLG
jgi:hypothetical protein